MTTRRETDPAMIMPSRRALGFERATAPFFRFFTASTWSRRQHESGLSDFVFGNPHEMPLPEFVDALRRASVPQNKDWFAYKNNEEAGRDLVASSLRASRTVPFEPQDVFLTNGAFAAIAVSLAALTDPGDEVIFISPPWFFYEALIAWTGAVPVRVRCDPSTFDLDLDAIEKALTDKTRAIIVNSPNNPTGRIYPPETLKRLGELLTARSRTNGRPIFLLSDEAYWRIRFDGRPYPSPVEHYPHSLLLYTYAKTLLTPGQRVGYVALSPTMPDREPVRSALFAAQLMTGWAFPNALLQHALADLEGLSIDLGHLQRKRDRLVAALSGMGYEVHMPEGTFYLLPRSPIADDWTFVEGLAAQGVMCLPGGIVELPGFFRISLTANDEMIERALPVFERALERARSQSA
jgi:aspartate aminotransferase